MVIADFAKREMALLQSEKILESYLKSHKVPHALLFVGANEEDLFQNALLFFKKVLKMMDAKKDHALKIDHMTHPDVHVLEPASLSRQYNIAQIKELEVRVSLFPSEAPRQVFILKNAERMAEPAANAFLKTLEEPSLRTLFILLTKQKESLFPTILSRLQKVHFTTEEKVEEQPHYILLKKFLENKNFSYSNLLKISGEVQESLDRLALSAKKDPKSTFFLDQEAKVLLTLLEKWYQKQRAESQNTHMPPLAFEKKIEKARQAIERSSKFSHAFEYILIPFVT